jgi:transcriptional regulator with XRE-family HTH domain
MRKAEAQQRTTLYKRRIERKLTQVELAELVEIKQQTVSTWDRGLAVPQGRYAKRRLEDVLGLPIGVLMEKDAATDGDDAPDACESKSTNRKVAADE